MATLICLQFGCSSGGHSIKTKLDDAVQRHASIEERIAEWGEPSEKEPSKDGQFVYTWKLPWSEQHFLPDGTAYPLQHGCTVVITVSSDHAIQSYKADDC